MIKNRVYQCFFVSFILLVCAANAATGDPHNIDIIHLSPMTGLEFQTITKLEGEHLNIIIKPKPGLIGSIKVDGQLVALGKENSVVRYRFTVDSNHQIETFYSSNSVSTFAVGGELTGLQGTMRISNNNLDLLQLDTSGSFEFLTELTSNTLYNVQIEQLPLNSVCSITNGVGVISTADITDINISCSSTIDNSVSLSGTVTAAPFIEVDSDINDPFAVANVNNGELAQQLENFFTINGFASAEGTHRTGQGDRFELIADEFDFYRINLQAQQSITMQVVDFSGKDVFQGDLDLFLFDSDSNLVASSMSVGEFENIIVPANGVYHVVVFALNGTSKYTLQFGAVGFSSTATTTRQNSSGDFIINEAIIKFKPMPPNQVNATQSNINLFLSHKETQRPALGKFQSPTLPLFGPSAKEATFMEELKRKNLHSYDKFNTLQRIKELNQQSDVEFAEPNFIYHGLRTPNDEFYPLQWHYPVMGLPQAWDITTGTSDIGDVIIAVIDTGVFLGHPDLAGQLVAGYDFISDPERARDGDGIDSNPDDPGDLKYLVSSSWHGTHVSGTIAARSNNNFGISGVAWGVKIMPLRVLGKNGGSSYDIAQAVRYAAGLPNDSGTLPAQKADIINLSLGGGGFSQSNQNVYNDARANGVIVVAAAGNSNVAQLFYPASYDGVISVSATDLNGNKAPYSNFGARVDIAAPGGDTSQDRNSDGFTDGVLSTFVDDSSGVRQASFYFMEGTSMAAPHIAGVAGLMKAVYPQLTPNEFDNLLANGHLTDEAGQLGWDDIFGFGMINAVKAVQSALDLNHGGNIPELPALITSTPSSLNFNINSDSALLRLSNEGGQAASIISIVENLEWLTITPDNTTIGINLGLYLVRVDRTGLDESFYSGSITFNLSTGDSLQVQVSMIVGNVVTTGNMGNLFLLLFNAENQEIVKQISLLPTDDSDVFSYTFEDIEAGKYFIVGGSDIDNDVFICQLAESCGAYPLLSERAEIEVSNQDITGLDFIVKILSTINSENNQSLTSKLSQQRGIKRLQP